MDEIKNIFMNYGIGYLKNGEAVIVDNKGGFFCNVAPLNYPEDTLDELMNIGEMFIPILEDFQNGNQAVLQRFEEESESIPEAGLDVLQSINIKINEEMRDKLLKRAAERTEKQKNMASKRTWPLFEMRRVKLEGDKSNIISVEELIEYMNMKDITQEDICVLFGRLGKTKEEVEKLQEDIRTSTTILEYFLEGCGDALNPEYDEEGNITCYYGIYYGTHQNKNWNSASEFNNGLFTQTEHCGSSELSCYTSSEVSRAAVRREKCSNDICFLAKLFLQPFELSPEYNKILLLKGNK